MSRIRQTIYSLLALSLFVFGGHPAFSQEVPAVKVEQLKANPQRYWASFFVFTDVLKERTGRQTMRIDGRKVFKFQTETLGVIYAEPDVAERMADLNEGEEYLFVGTVLQRPPSRFSFSRQGSFVIIIRDITPFQQNAADIPGRLSGINLGHSDNPFNLVFKALDQIMRDVNKDMFGYASNNNISLTDMFGDPEHRSKVAASVRSAIRRYEDVNRTSGQEFFVQVIVSMIALQYGYVDPAAAAFEPEADAVPQVLLPMDDDDLRPEDWDLSEP